MEYTSYQITSTETNSLNTGSYLNRTDYSMFVGGFVGDLWYGFSSNDVLEIGVYDRTQTPIDWKTVHQEKNYKFSQYSYFNVQNVPVTYSYAELLPDFILYKNEKVLISPPVEIDKAFNITQGSYVLTYNFTREMAGTPASPLIIKDISPSRTELKIVPVGETTLQYEAFCKKTIQMGDVSPLYLQLIEYCPISQIYGQISSQYTNQINTIKNLFFLATDGEMVNFIRNLYEDLYVYTNPPTSSMGTMVADPDVLLRIQGIKTYFNNYLRSNVHTLSTFDNIDNQFYSFVDVAIQRKFISLGPNPSAEYVAAKKFLKDFFTIHFYQPISNLLSSTYNEKYLSYLRNAINFGNGRLLPILNHAYLDERIESSDPLTLLVKLQSELPSDIASNTNCWISNISQTPFVVNSILKRDGGNLAITIGPPNFSANIPEISIGNVNKSYTATDLANEQNIERELVVSKKEKSLNIDYSDFKNFVVFSSAEARVNIFKNKIVQLSTLTASLQELNEKNITHLLTSGSDYPYYTLEHDRLQEQLDAVVDNFDGYEAYLYRQGGYAYNDGTFISSSYVSTQDISASYYDRYNRDSLINNTPSHIVADENNDEYLTFLAMAGHFFDDIYTYISNLPSEKFIGQGDQETFTREVTDHMLETFGWKLDDTLEQTNMLNNYLTSNELSGLNAMSAEERTKAIRNRVLLNLPKIYKTKGTETSVKLLLSCYGIPSSLISLREYGGVNYAEEIASYTQFERAYMYQWDTSSKLDHFRITLPGVTRTFEYKFSIPDAKPYTYGHKQITWGVVASGASTGSISGSGFVHGGFVRERGQNLGRIFFAVGYKDAEDFIVYSDPIPIFDGNVYSVMIRKNDYDPYFQYTADYNAVPTKYDLYVQRNDSGRSIIQSKISYINYNEQSNYTFEGAGTLMIGNWFQEYNHQGYTGTLDKFMVWLDPITDANYEDHVNNVNSYAYSGSQEGYKSLVFRMHTDYPFDLRQFAPGQTSSSYFPYTPEWNGIWINANPYYANGAYLASWQPWSGSQQIVYDPLICKYISQSCYPFQFKVIDYPCTYTISKYGPNKFRNEKIKYLTQTVDARLDTEERSTYVEKNQIAPDSNMVGFFADPQEFKNRDILRYFGNFDFMDAIGHSQYAFDDSYNQLKGLRKTYSTMLNSSSGSTARFNELLTIYRLYFNRSIFEAIKNLTPARNNTLTGVLIEPTILERPKYQARPIDSEVNMGSAVYDETTVYRYFHDTDSQLVRISNTLQDTVNVNISESYINLPSRTYPPNYVECILDLPDRYQFSHFGDGAIKGQMAMDMNIQHHPSGSKKYYIVKEWNTYKIWKKEGEWNKTDNPSENNHVTSSVQLYRYVCVSDELYNSLVYTSLTNNGNVLPDPGLHFANTFKNTPNMMRNNIYANPIDQFGDGTSWIMGGSYYELGDSFLEIAPTYPRNHFIHKRSFFSPSRFLQMGKEGKTNVFRPYTKNQQTIDTTIGVDGITDGTLPVQSFDVSNINLVKSDNVINQ